MIIKICNDVVCISDDEIINTKNYVESLPYMRHLHITLSLLKDVVKLNKLKFAPTFKGRKTSKEMNLVNVSEKEKKMLLFKIKSDLFSVDNKLVDKIKSHLNKICESIIFDKGEITFNLDESKINSIKK